LKSVYIGSFSNLVYGSLPPDSDALDSLNKIKERIVSIAWTVEM